VLAAAAQPEVAVVHEELDAVLLGGNRVRLGLLHDLQRRDRQLDAAWGPGILSDPADHDQAALL
jgi:hypothetical protein